LYIAGASMYYYYLGGLVFDPPWFLTHRAFRGSTFFSSSFFLLFPSFFLAHPFITGTDTVACRVFYIAVRTRRFTLIGAFPGAMFSLKFLHFSSTLR